MGVMLCKVLEIKPAFYGIFHSSSGHLDAPASCRWPVAPQMGLAGWQGDSSSWQNSPDSLGFRSGRLHRPPLWKSWHTVQATAVQEAEQGNLVTTPRPKQGPSSHAHSPCIVCSEAPHLRPPPSFRARPLHDHVQQIKDGPLYHHCIPNQ